MKKIAVFLLISFAGMQFVYSLSFVNKMSESFKRKDSIPTPGEVSYNGKAKVVNCMSFTNLGKVVKQEDKKFNKRVCTDNPGQAKERCFAQKNDCKECVKDGNYLISTGQNQGTKGKGLEEKTPILYRTKSGPELGYKILGKIEPKEGAKPEMEDKEPRPCCTKQGVFPNGAKICIETIGDPVKQFGELKGGENYGHTDEPSQTPIVGNSPLRVIREALSI